MTASTRKRIIIIAVAVLVLVVIVYGFQPSSIPVATEPVTRGALEVVIEDEGETHVRDRYVVSSPVAAHLRRIALEEGDAVERGEVVVRLEAPRAPLLDTRARTESLARVESARAAQTEAEERARSAVTTARQAADERRRAQRLFDAGSATRQTLDRAIAEDEQADAAAEAAQAGVEAARAELTRAQAVLGNDDDASDRPILHALQSPVKGRVLTLHKKSEGPVNAGEPLVDVGDPDSLEVRVDVLSQDAVRIRPRTRVRIAQWGGEGDLEAVVERILPQGETHVSSLGVEEKRVTVIARFASDHAHRAGLGVGFRVLAQFIVSEAEDVLIVPTSALFRTESGWSVFRVVDGTAAFTPVEIGRRTGLRSEVLGGLSEGDAVIVHPDNAIEDGTEVAPLDE